MSRKYILNSDHSVTQVDDLLAWARAFEESTRILAKADRQGFHVSTVFLGVDHSFGDGPPLIFETMIFAGHVGGEDVYQERYSTWDEAMAGHRRALESVAQLEVAE